MSISHAVVPLPRSHTQVVPACGFGFGDCVVMELLRDRGLIPTLSPLIDFVVMAFNTEMRPHAVRVAALLRQASISPQIIPPPSTPYPIRRARAFRHVGCSF